MIKKTSGYIYIVLVPFLLLSLWGCYTSFQHPPIDDPQWGSVRISDDCGECHNQQKYAAPILPDGAQHDAKWNFYSSSPWWQDNWSYGNDFIAGPETTGPRMPGGGGGYSDSPAVPIPPAPAQSLGKSSADESNESGEKKDNRRSVGRRTHTTSDSNSSEAPQRGDKRSRRSE